MLGYLGVSKNKYNPSDSETAKGKSEGNSKL